MKIIATKETLINVIKRASKVANGRSMLPIYNHYAFSTDGITCTITASDGVRSYSEIFECEEKGEAGQCTLEAVKINRAISSMKSGKIEISKGHITQGKTKIKLESMDYDAFPIPNLESATDTGMNSLELIGICSTICHAMPTKDVRPMLNGVHLTKDYAVATDGHRLAFVDSSYSGEDDVIIPADTIRSLPDIDGKISISSHQMIIDAHNITYSTALVDAKFPDWKRIIPKDFESELKIQKTDILEALKAVQIGGEMVKLDISKDKVTLSNDGATTECACSNSKDIQVAFMIQYLLDAINQCIESEIVIKLGNAKACLINDNFVIMPVRI